MSSSESKLSQYIDVQNDMFTTLFDGLVMSSPHLSEDQKRSLLHQIATKSRKLRRLRREMQKDREDAQDLLLEKL